MVDLINTVWKLEYDDGDVEEITFLKNGTFKSLVIESQDENFKGHYNEGEKHTWDLNDLLITISYTDGFRILSGEINSEFKKMVGTHKNKQGLTGKWSGKLIPETLSQLLKLKSEKMEMLEVGKLKSVGFGRYADPETGEIVAKMQDGKLVPVS